MASKRPFTEEEFSCPVCRDVFTHPVVLTCGHSFCRGCIEEFWNFNKTRRCPVCRQTTEREPSLNFTLRNLCQSFVNHRRFLEEHCEVHQLRKTLVCCEDEQLMCEGFKFPASSSSLGFIRGLARHPRCGLVISHLDGSSVSRQVLLEVGLHLGPRLDSLALPGSSITESCLLELLPRLTSLRKLDLQGLDSLFMSGAFLSDLSFNRLTICTPGLRRLSLSGCHISFEFDPYRGCPVGSGSSALVSLRNLLNLLQKQTSTLRSLDLSRTGITPKSLRSISKLRGLRLEELNLHGCKELTDYSIEILCKYQSGLRMLDLSGCMELSCRAVLAVGAELKELRVLSFSQDWKITDKGLAELMMLPHLRSLDLSECLRFL